MNRPLPFEDVKKLLVGNRVFLERLDTGKVIPGMVIYNEDDYFEGGIGLKLPSGILPEDWREYNKSWRLWVSEPSDEDRKDAKWGEKI